MGKNLVKTSKKFLPKSLTSRVIPILRLIDNGYYEAEIGKKLDFSKQLVHYYCKRFEKQGYVIREVKSSCVFRRLTQTGKNFLSECERRFINHRVFRLHNLVVGYSIVRDAKTDVDWRKVKLKNWIKRVGSFCDCSIEHTTKKLIVYANVVEGSNPWELLYRAWSECDTVASKLEGQFGMLLGRGKLVRKPHFGIYDPKLLQSSKYFELTSDAGKIDESEGNVEAEWFSPEAASDYLLMPLRTANTEREVIEIKESMQIFAEAMNQHVSLIKELREITQALKLAIESVGRMNNGRRLAS